jgi:hypothetical protein
MLQVLLLLSLKILLQKEAWGYAEIIQIKKERERKRKIIERMDKCPKEK